MSLTRHQAESNLRQAIIDHAIASGIHPEGELLNEFAIVANWAKVEHNGRYQYTTHYSSELVPIHIAVGLFKVGERMAIEESEK